MPIDLEPNPTGSVVLHRNQEGTLIARTPSHGQLAGMREAGYETWMPHFRDCPLAEVYRDKKRKGKR